MKYKSQAQLAEEALSLSAALVVAKLSGWSFDPLTSIAPKACRGFLHEPRCELVLIPYAVDQLRADVEARVGELRTDALIIQEAAPGLEPSFLASFVTWDAGQARWLGPCRLWLSQDERLWLAADQGCDRWGPCLELAQTRLRPTAVAPWSSGPDRDAGFARADAMIARLAEETPA